MLRIPPDLKILIADHARKTERSQQWVILRILANYYDAEQNNRPTLSTEKSPNTAPDKADSVAVPKRMDPKADFIGYDEARMIEFIVAFNQQREEQGMKRDNHALADAMNAQGFRTLINSEITSHYISHFIIKNCSDQAVRPKAQD